MVKTPKETVRRNRVFLKPKEQSKSETAQSRFPIPHPASEVELIPLEPEDSKKDGSPTKNNRHKAPTKSLDTKNTKEAVTKESTPTAVKVTPPVPPAVTTAPQRTTSGRVVNKPARLKDFV